MDPYLGEIRMFPGNFAPLGWQFCEGQLLSIAQNTALFTLLGTTYGGDGQSTFALPDLRGRLPVGIGQGPGMGNYTIGQRSGSKTVTLTTNNLPSHTHSLMATTSAATAPAPAGDKSLADTGTVALYTSDLTSRVSMNPNSLSVQGGSQPFSNLMPSLTINFIIALEGIYPTRN